MAEAEAPKTSRALLPDGLSEEPPGWRDTDGLSPIDVLYGYLRERFAVDEWATAESRRTSTYGRGGEMTAGDKEIYDQIWTRLREVGDRFLTDSARKRSWPSFGQPSEHDPDRNTVVAVVRPRRGRVKVTVQYRPPGGYPEARLPSETYRYDFAMAAGAWRLDNRLSLRPGERPIGGLV